MSQLSPKIEILSPNPVPATTLVRNLLPRHQNYRKQLHLYISVQQATIITQLFGLFFFLAQEPQVTQGLLIHEVSRLHTTTHHSWQDSSGRVISSSRRSLPHNTQHSQQTSMPRWDSNLQSHQARGRRPKPFRTRNPLKRKIEGPHLRQCGHIGLILCSLCNCLLSI